VRKSKIPLYIFFLLLSVVLLSNLALSRESKNETQFTAEEQTHQLNVSSTFNETTTYADVGFDYLEFRIQVENWENNLGGLYQGLIISLVWDTNGTELKSWLISFNDVEEHYFTTETRVNGIVRIVFKCMNVEYIGYNLIVSDKYTLWTYELHCRPEFDIYFGVERSEYNTDVLQFVLEFNKNFSNESMFSVGVYDENNASEEYFESSMNYFPENNLILDAIAIPDIWYRLSFELENYNSTDWIYLKLFYDHIDPHFIVRLFLNKGENSLNQIPLDFVHSDYQYWWYVDYYPNEFAGLDILFILLTILKYVIPAILIVGVTAAFIRSSIKQKRKRNTMDFNPSNKYHYANENVSYKPQPTLAVDFDHNPKNYGIKTTESSKVSCSICLQIIDDHSNLIRCPSCDIAYHKNHLYQWIVGNGTCPACRSRLRITSK